MCLCACCICSLRKTLSTTHTAYQGWKHCWDHSFLPDGEEVRSSHYARITHFTLGVFQGFSAAWKCVNVDTSSAHLTGWSPNCLFVLFLFGWNAKQSVFLTPKNALKTESISKQTEIIQVQHRGLQALGSDLNLIHHNVNHVCHKNACWCLYTIHFLLSYLVRLTEERVGGTTLVDDVSDQVFLPVVGGKNADTVRRVAQQAHVHVQSHRILSLCQVLCRKREKGRCQY